MHKSTHRTGQRGGHPLEEARCCRVSFETVENPEKGIILPLGRAYDPVAQLAPQSTEDRTVSAHDSQEMVALGAYSRHLPTENVSFI